MDIIDISLGVIEAAEADLPFQEVVARKSGGGPVFSGGVTS